MSTLLTTSLLIMVLIFALVTQLWLVSLGQRDSSIVDIAWAPGFAIISWSNALLAGTNGLRAWLVLALVTLWAFRLALHIAARHHGEDHRYTAMRAKHGVRWWWWSLFQVFWLQALLCWLISWPLQLAVTRTAPLNILDAVGFTIAAAGFLYEAIADWQLQRFRTDPANKGHVMDRGLWRFSRHPNYFGDALMWWGYFLIGLATSDAWWSIFAPIAMTVLLLRVSGVSLMEETITDRRPKYADYIRRTSAFVPWPPT
jgi:steroid 5-alpha reductase family enzyme